MKILAINICLRPYLKQTYPPMGLGYILTAINRAGFDCELLDIDAHRYSDSEVEKIIRTKKFDVAVFGCIVTGYKIVKWLADTIKQKDKKIPIIVGNSVATSIPELLLSKTKADIAVMGEGDITIVELLSAIADNSPLEEVKGIYFKKGQEVIKTEKRPSISEIDQIPNINWDLFDIDLYLDKSKDGVSRPYIIDYDSVRCMSVVSARGCFYNCTFCYHVFKGERYRVRSPKAICDEIKQLKEKYSINFIKFRDDLTFYSKAQCSALCDEIIKEGLNDLIYSACARADLLGEDDFELAQKMKKAGFNYIIYSLESADPEILRAMNKNISADSFKIQTRIFQEAGIFTATSLVFGYPQETKKTIQKTFDTCFEANIYPSVGYITPQPGTAIYDYAKKKGKICDDERYLIDVIGDRQDFRINLTCMEQEDMESIVVENLYALSNKLNFKLSKDGLIKTGQAIGVK